jgi:hypothetical protein
VADLLSRISSVSLRAEEEAGSGILSVRDLVSHAPPMSSRVTQNTRHFNVGLHSPPSPDLQHASPVSNEPPGSIGRSAAVASSMAMLVAQVAFTPSPSVNLFVHATASYLHQVPLRVVNLHGRKIPDCFAAADAVRFFDFLCPSR